MTYSLYRFGLLSGLCLSGRLRYQLFTFLHPASAINCGGFNVSHRRHSRHSSEHNIHIIATLKMRKAHALLS